MPGFVVSREQGQWFSDLGIVLDEPGVEVAETKILL